MSRSRLGEPVRDGGNGQQGTTGRTDLNRGVQLGTDPAIEARGPAAVVDLDFLKGVLPVVPEPIAIETRVKMIPRQDLVIVVFSCRVPVEVNAGAGQRTFRTCHPAVVREVLAPAVEAAAIAPDRLDDLADPAVAAAQQSLDCARLAVVIAEPDRSAVLAIPPDCIQQLAQPGVNRFVTTLTGPLEGSVRLGYECPDADSAPDVAATADRSSSCDHLLCQIRNGQHVLVGLGRQAAHEIELHLTPAVRVRRCYRANQILLGDHLVDYLAQPLGTALGRERQARSTAIAGEFVGKVDVEGIDPGAGQRK